MITAKLNKSVLSDILKRLEDLPKAFSQSDAQALGNELVPTMKSLIAGGTSPIRGVGRFEGYKHAGVKGKYPDSAKRKYPGKRDRPVNLNLSGDMLDALTFKTYKAKYGYGVELGYYSESASKKEQGHRDGVNGQPKRPTIPVEGEQLAAKMQSVISKRFNEAISKFVKQK